MQEISAKCMIFCTPHCKNYEKRSAAHDGSISIENMRMTHGIAGMNLHESRLLPLRESGFGEHIKEYGKDLQHTYITGKKGLDRGLGAIGMGANLVLKAGDEIFKGALGQAYNAPRGIAGHTRADLSSLLQNMVHIRPIRAMGDLWSLATADIPLDTINLLTGNTQGGLRSQTRNSMARTMAA